MTIIVGVDGSDDGWAALNYLARLLKTTRRATGETQVVLYHACDLPPAPSGDAPFVDGETFAQLQDAIVSQAAELLTEAEDLLRRLLDDDPLTIRLHHSFAAPARGLSETAANEGADLIVVGSRGLTGLQQLALGSVSRRISEAAPCPVLIVREGVVEDA